jgi:hypothetical protein
MTKKSVQDENKKQYHFDIKKASYEVIKTALEVGFEETSNFITFYVNCAKLLRDSVDPEYHVKKTAIKIFPDNITWEQKKNEITFKYKGKLREDLLKLYSLYASLSILERKNSEETRLTDDDIDDLLNRL